MRARADSATRNLSASGARIALPTRSYTGSPFRAHNRRPKMLEMEDGVQIDVQLEQTGGA